MKNKLCFKKYINRIIKNSIFALVALGFCFLMGNVARVIFGAIAVSIFAVIIVSDIYCYFSYVKKADGLQAKEGVIFNWHPAGRKSYVASVSLKEGDTEYESPNYFGLSEASEMVGKRVLYVVINDDLLIYEVLE